MDVDLVYDKLVTYLRRYDETFLEEILKFPEEYNKKILSELKSRIKKFSDFKELITFFYHDSKIPENSLFLNEKMKISDMDIVKK